MICDFVEAKGIGVSSYYYVKEGDDKLIKTRNLGDLYVGGDVEYVEITKNVSDKRVIEGDLLIGLIGPTFGAAIVSKEFEGSYFTNNVFRVRPNSENIGVLLVTYLNSLQGKGRLKALSVGQTISRVKQEDILNLKISFPSKKHVQKIARVFTLLYEKNRNLSEVRRVNKEIRDQLIKEAVA